MKSQETTEFYSTLNSGIQVNSVLQRYDNLIFLTLVSGLFEKSLICKNPLTLKKKADEIWSSESRTVVSNESMKIVSYAQ